MAYDKFIADRNREGENLKADLLEKLCKLDECAAFFKEWQPKMECYFKDTITKKFNELLGDFVERPQGKPTLVPEDDNRPRMNTAKEDFKEEI